MSTVPRPAFSAYGIELEYMLVSRTSLDVQPIADVILAQAQRNAAETGGIDWSNELALHVVEIKNIQPGPLSELIQTFQNQVRQLDTSLADIGACLMPTAMHPWMDPSRDTVLWPHDNQAIYATFHQLFDCKRHAWANVQSMHVNLPFADDRQFEKLMAAVRVVLPLLPAIAASSPLADGAVSGYMDYRMHVYRNQSPNQPSIVGAIVPDVVRSRAEHGTRVLEPMYADIQSLDPGQELRFEWLNARGAIPRFDRNAIEIRVMDMQECPLADVALAALVIDLTELLYEGEFASLGAQQELSTTMLSRLLFACNRDADQTLIEDSSYLSLLRFPDRVCTAEELWSHLAEILLSRGAPHQQLWQTHLSLILRHGPLARRILRALAGNTSRPAMHEVYRRLVTCLSEGKPFLV